MKLVMKTYLIAALALSGAILPSSVPAQTGGGGVPAALLKREFGTASNEMWAIEKEIQNARPDQYPRIEARLIGVLESPEATMPAKQFACQMLRTVGSAKCVPAVSKLLVDEQLSHIARFVLLGMREPAVDAELRKALGQAKGKLRIGIINTIGDRADRQSVKAVAALLKNEDEATIRSALNAIGKIGGLQAAEALDRARQTGPLQEAWAHAYLRCAGSLTEPGQSSRAEKMYQSLFDGGSPLSVRAAALPALAQMQKERAVPLIVKVLSTSEAMMKRAAVSCVISVPGNAATRAFVQALPKLAPEYKATLLGALAVRGDADGVTESINSLAVDENAAVRQAAIKSLARLGNAASVPILAAALKDGGAISTDAAKALTELQGDGVADALIKQAGTGDAAVRAGVLKILAERGQVEALPVFRKALTDDDSKIRRAALKTIAALGTQEDVSRLVEMLTVQKDDAERDLLAGAITEVAGRMPNHAARCQPMLQAIPTADVAAKISLLKILSSLGGDPALQAVRSSLTGEAQVRKAAIEALAEWPDPAPMPDLLALAKDGKESTEKAQALRGYIRLAGLTSGSAKLEAYRQALELATRSEERWSVLSGLAGVGQVEALKMVEPFLEDVSVRREAFVAYEKIAEALIARQPAVGQEALQRVVDQAADSALRNKAKAALERVKK